VDQDFGSGKGFAGLTPLPMRRRLPSRPLPAYRNRPPWFRIMDYTVSGQKEPADDAVRTPFHQIGQDMTFLDRLGDWRVDHRNFLCLDGMRLPFISCAVWDFNLMLSRRRIEACMSARVLPPVVSHRQVCYSSPVPDPWSA
jgi:hypothetical protein